MFAGRTSTELPRLPGLEGREVVIAGRLSALSRVEAFERLLASGARLAERIGPRTAWVVLPRGALPLAEDGALDGTLEDARRRIEDGQDLELIDEDELLRRLGLAAARTEARRLYTTAQLARILSISPSRVTAWVRSGLLRPAHVERRLARFEFRDVAQARALARLVRRGVHPRRLRASLAALSRWWPAAGDSLARLDAFEENGRLVVRTPRGDLADPSGQLRLDFPGAPAAEPAGEAAPLPHTSDSWFERAVQLEEEERLEEAAQAYARALDPGKPRPEAAFNLGNVLFALERAEEAAAAFMLAVELDAEYVEAWNNLGNAHSALGRHQEAEDALRRALALEPDYADAHFNLAEVLAGRGELEDARAHWRTYLEHDPDSAWAAEVRARLRRTDPVAAHGARPGPTTKSPPRPELPDEGGPFT